MMPPEILNYQVVRKIGEGSMGEVYLAQNKSIHQFVAIKRLHPRWGNNKFIRDRFRQEAILLSSLNHPNIVRFLNYVENEQGVFLIMEYVDGMTLEDFILKKNGLIVEQRAYPMMIEILDAFAYAHQRNIVHRDIKPGNLLLTKDGHVKVLDFGIAQIISDSEDEGFQTSGSLLYMSPEQVHNRPVDIRSDIYSLGVLFYQMLTGRPPYDASSLTRPEIMNLISSVPLKRMKEVYPYISDNLQMIIDKATNKNPGERFSKCEDMRKAVIKSQRMSDNKFEEKSEGQDPNKKKAFTIVWISLAALIILSTLGWSAYMIYNRNATKSFIYYVTHNAVPEGIMPVSGSKNHYEFRYANGQVESVKMILPSGRDYISFDSIFLRYFPESIEFAYDKNGEIIQEKILDNKDSLLYIIQFKDRMRKAIIKRNSSDTVPIYLRMHYDPSSGILNKVIYTNSSGENSPRKTIAGEKYSYDSKSRLKRISFFDSMNLPVALPSGVAMYEFFYSPDSLKVNVCRYDIKGRKIE